MSAKKRLDVNEIIKQNLLETETITESAEFENDEEFEDSHEIDNDDDEDADNETDEFYETFITPAIASSISAGLGALQFRQTVREIRGK